MFSKSALWACCLFGCTVLGSVPAYAQPINGFVEQAANRGVIFVTPYGIGNGADTFGYGMALSDLDSDGDLDLVLTGRFDGSLGLYENDGLGYFTDRSAGIPVADVSISGVSAADYDADGDLDLYLSGYLTPNYLLRNDGGFHFTDVTALAGGGLDDPGAGCGSSWADYDGDGWIDLYLVNRTGTMQNFSPNRLFRNKGDGTFESVGAALGIEDPCWGFQAVWLDYDRDGDVDLYLSNDKGNFLINCYNRLWRNDGGTFTDVSYESGTAIAIDSMGLAVADYDNNGFEDIYCTNVPPANPFFQAIDGTTFQENALALGIASHRLGWGAHFFDWDHDSHYELFVATEYFPTQFFSHAGTFPAVDISHSVGLALVGSSYATAIGDIDSDGDLDLVVQQIYDPIRIYVSNTHLATSSKWLKVRLHGAWPNLNAIGAAVEVQGAGGFSRYQEARAGVSFKSSSALDLHFGLGSHGTVNVVVTWPGGGGTTTITGVSSNQTLEIYEDTTDCNANGIVDYEDIRAGEKDENGNWRLDICEPKFVRGDCNGDLMCDVSDVVTLLQYFGGLVAPLCYEALDANSDLGVDLADPTYLIYHLFGAGTDPDAPFPHCDLDPTGVLLLSCDQAPICQ